MHNGMQTVFHNSEDVTLVGPEWIAQLKSAAVQSPQRRARLCLHGADDDALHQMIIAAAGDCLFPPHRHPRKSESFHMIEGRLAVILFADDGTALESLLLSAVPRYGALCYRLSTPRFHTVLPLDDVVVYHEITNGPFRQGDTEIAQWAPAEPGLLRRFIQHSAVETGIPRNLLLRPEAVS